MTLLIQAAAVSYAHGGNRVLDGWVVGVHRFDDGETAWVRLLHFHGVTRIVLIHRERRHKYGAINADLVHRDDHFVTGHMRRPVRHFMPWTAGRIGFVGVDLGVYDHDLESPCWRTI